MINILITGKNSYVGKSFAKWLSNFPDKYSVEFISLRNEDWLIKDFSKYDVVLHTAAIVHRKETNTNSDSYYKINRDLTYAVAKKSRDEGVKQFIFLSSMSVYGIEIGNISSGTIEKPKSNYGKSKLQGEKLINTLNDDNFIVSIIRPPMIYGQDCSGNYVRLKKLATKTPIFPNIQNERSMIYIENLCEFIRLLVERPYKGVYFPQDEEYVCTTDMVQMIARINSKNIRITSFFNFLFHILKLKTIKKVFGNLTYDKQLSAFEDKYCIYSFEESIRRTEVK